MKTIVVAQMNGFPIGAWGPFESREAAHEWCEVRNRAQSDDLKGMVLALYDPAVESGDSSPKPAPSSSTGQGSEKPAEPPLLTKPGD